MLHDNGDGFRVVSGGVRRALDNMRRSKWGLALMIQVQVTGIWSEWYNYTNHCQCQILARDTFLNDRVRVLCDEYRTWLIPYSYFYRTWLVLSSYQPYPYLFKIPRPVLCQSSPENRPFSSCQQTNTLFQSVTGSCKRWRVAFDGIVDSVVLSRRGFNYLN